MVGCCPRLSGRQQVAGQRGRDQLAEPRHRRRPCLEQVARRSATTDHSDDPARSGRAPRPAGGPDPSVLTARETEVVRLVARGLSNGEIATALSIGLGTVKTHAAAAQRKVGARNRVGVAAWAWGAGLVEGT